jgi:dTDP-4-dehydrorhamnose 3,5-epimerase
MKFHPTELQDAVLIEMTPFRDPRGYFSRTFCEEEFGGAGLATRFVQANMSHNPKEGTLRGMHYQVPPHAEVKVIRCVKGAICDVIADLRPESPTYMKSQGFLLTEDNQMQLYVPEGFAHGFITLAENTSVNYLVTAFYAPGAERGLRWNDPALKLRWPAEPTLISDKDASWPDYDPASVT